MKFGYCRITIPDRAAKILQKLNQNNVEIHSVEFETPLFINVKYWKILNWNKDGIYLQGYIGDRIVVEKEFFYFKEFTRGLLLWYIKIPRKSSAKIDVNI